MSNVFGFNDYINLRFQIITEFKNRSYDDEEKLYDLIHEMVDEYVCEYNIEYLKSVFEYYEKDVYDVLMDYSEDYGMNIQDFRSKTHFYQCLAFYIIKQNMDDDMYLTNEINDYINGESDTTKSEADTECETDNEIEDN